jgi:aspartate dehydrogenase
MKTRLGIIGSGVIGGYLYRQITSAGDAVVTFVYDADRGKRAGIPPELRLDAPEKMATKEVDLVVEAAHPKAVRQFGPTVLRQADFLPLSLTAFADALFRAEMEDAAHAAGKAIYIPHGAILALDGIADGRKVLESVRVTTVKSPRSLGVSPDGIDKPVAIYDGPTRGACDKFPPTSTPTRPWTWRGSASTAPVPPSLRIRPSTSWPTPSR